MLLQNKYLFAIASWFNSLELVGYQSRMRTKFVKVLTEHAQKIDDERKAILESYAKKEEDGKFVLVKDANGMESYDLDDEDVLKFKAEYQDVLDKNAIFLVDDSNRDIYNTLKRIIAETDKKVGGEVAEAYDAFCDALEKVA